MTRARQLASLKMFSSRVMCMSIKEAKSHGVMTQEQIDAGHGCVKSGLAVGAITEDDPIVAVWYSRKLKAYRWEI